MQISKILRGKIVILILILLFALFFSLFINFTVREGNTTPAPTPAPTRATQGPTPAPTSALPTPATTPSPTVGGQRNKCGGGSGTASTVAYSISGPTDQCFKNWYAAVRDKNNSKYTIACSSNETVYAPTNVICQNFKDGNTQCKAKTLNGGVTVCSSV